jgi:hypothetical protein
MIRVGDPIFRMRAAGPDPCATLPPPNQLTITTSAGGSLTGNVYTVGTFLTPWGETLPSSETFTSMGTNGTLNASAVVPPGAITFRVYFGTTPGGEAQYQALDLLGAGIQPGQTATISISGLTLAIPSPPPQQSSAYVLDSDGGFVSASVAFQWLNQALRQMCVTLGGIRDISGVAWPSQAAWAVLSQRWTEIQNFWWAGWWQVVGAQEYTWLISPVQSVPGYVTSWGTAGQDIVGLWPQPGQGPATTTLTANVGLTDQVLNVTATNTFFVPGMVQIDNEFMLVSSFNTAGTQFVGVVRGVGGTVAATHSSGATVTQLIAMFTGTRLAPEFVPGAAYSWLQLPAGWDAPLDSYLLARYREKEQDHQTATMLDQKFMAMVEQLRSSRDAVPKNRQVGDSRVYEAFAGYRTQYPFSILFP